MVMVIFMVLISFGLIIDVTSYFPKCSYFRLFNMEHYKLTSRVVGHDRHYVPKNSCFLCTKPKCKFEEKGCNKRSSTVNIPVYENLLEFGVFYSHFPKFFTAKITINKTCGLQIQAHSNVINKEILFTWSRCINNFKTCKRLNAIRLDIDNDARSCFLHTYKFINTNLISSSVHGNCFYTSTDEILMYAPIKKLGCPFDQNSPITVRYEVAHHENTTEDGLPIIVPCSPGGYVVDSNTGRFVSGELCRDLFSEMWSGVSFYITRFYNRSEQYTFPAYSKTRAGEIKRRRRIPIYFDNHGIKPLSTKAMKPEAYNCSFTIKRTGACNISIEQPDMKALNKNARCLAEYNERKEEQNIEVKSSGAKFVNYNFNFFLPKR